MLNKKIDQYEWVSLLENVLAGQHLESYYRTFCSGGRMPRRE